MTSPLENLCGPGKPLRKEPPDAKEFAGRKRSGHTRLADAGNVILTYADLYAAMEQATARLGREVNPTVYSRKELARRVKQKNAFVTRVMAQPRIWLIGAESDLASR